MTCMCAATVVTTLAEGMQLMGRYVTWHSCIVSAVFEAEENARLSNVVPTLSVAIAMSMVPTMPNNVG